MAFDVTQRLTELCESDRYPIERWSRSNSFPVSGQTLPFGELRGSRRIDSAFCTWIRQNADPIPRLPQSIRRPQRDHWLEMSCLDVTTQWDTDGTHITPSTVESHRKPSLVETIPSGLGVRTCGLWDSRWQSMLSSAEKLYSPQR